MWNACNSMRETPKEIQVLSLHPKNIALTYVPGTNNQHFLVHLLSYIPLFFSDVFNEEENLFIYPKSSEQVKSCLANEVYSDRTELYTLGCLIAYLYTGKLPYHEGTTSEMLKIDYEHNCINIPTKEMFIRDETNENEVDDEMIEECIKLLKGIFYDELLWKDTFNNPFIQHCIQCAHNEEFTPENYEIIKELGSGQYGIAYLANQNTQRGKRVVAIKDIPYDEEEEIYLERELTIMKMCDHPNIVKLYDILFLDSSLCNDYNDRCIDIVMECCDGGHLGSFLKKNYPHGVDDDKMLKHIVISLSKGLSYLHQELNVIHRDLKPENILLKNNPLNHNRPFLKIADFGLSRIADERGNAQTVCGTPMFMAPQVIYRQTYTYKCDLFSLGVIFFNARTQSFPFGVPRDVTMLQNRMLDKNYPIYDPQYWGKQPDFEKLVKGLIVFNEYDRSGWNEIFENEYMKSAIEQFKEEN